MAENSVHVCDEIEDEVTRYAYREKLSPDERSRVEEHLKECSSCSEVVFFIQKTRDRENPIRFKPAAEPCPDAATIIAFADDTVDQETAQRLGVHLLHCKRCQEAYLFLRSLNEEQFEERVLESLDAPRWTDVVIRAAIKAGKKIVEAGTTIAQKGLEIISVSGSGHVVQLEPVAMLGKGDESSSSLTIEDAVKDEETGATASVKINIAVDPEGAATLHLASRPPQREWTVSLATPDSHELMRAPLVDEDTLLGSDLADPSYVISIRKDERALASFSLELRPA